MMLEKSATPTAVMVAEDQAGSVTETMPEPEPLETEIEARRVLVPLDGSGLAEKVLPHALAIAGALGCGLRLVRVVQPPVFVDPTGSGGASMAAVWDAWAHEPQAAREYLEEVASKLRSDKLEVDVQVLEGNAAVSIVEYAKRDRRIEIIAMSSHGRGGLGRWVFGSVTEKVLQTSPVPLVVVRSEDERGEITTQQASYKHVLVPLDGSAFSEHALEYAELLAEAVGAQIVLFTVTDIAFDMTLVQAGGAPGWTATAWDRETEYLNDYLNGLAEGVRDAGVEASVQLAYGDPATEILRVSNELVECLVVMSTHGRGGLRGFLLGSVARKVSQSATAPLLLVRIKGEET